MKKYNFDKIIDRNNTNSVKYNILKNHLKDSIPMWIADMDFESPTVVKEAIIKCAQQNIFGYISPSDHYYESIINWIFQQHHFSVDRDWIDFIPGVVKGIAFALDTFTKEGDKIIIQPPVYPPFHTTSQLRNRELVYNPLILDEGQYKMNFDHLKKIIKGSKLLVLSNPHNPGGRVWLREELEELSEICLENKVLIISDEIHNDLVFEPYKYTMLADISNEIAQNSITFMSPSKTFNIAGLISSYSIIPNAELRKSYRSFMHKSELDQGHTFAYLSLESVYTDEGLDWLLNLKKYLLNNIKLVDQFLKLNIPQIKPMIPQASFLIWLDCRELNLPQSELVEFFNNKAHLILNNGENFGVEGIGFMRLNIGCPYLVVEKALNQLKNAVNNLN